MMSNPMSACQAIVVLIDPDDRKLPQPAILRSAFDLTDAESRLAALLLSGDSLEDLCDRLQIAKETGRNQLKSIFAKTGTHRQVELVLTLNSLLSPQERSRKYSFRADIVTQQLSCPVVHGVLSRLRREETLPACHSPNGS